jgi:hypothetical protein
MEAEPEEARGSDRRRDGWGGVDIAGDRRTRSGVALWAGPPRDGRQRCGRAGWPRRPTCARSMNSYVWSGS